MVTSPCGRLFLNDMVTDGKDPLERTGVGMDRGHEQRNYTEVPLPLMMICRREQLFSVRGPVLNTVQPQSWMMTLPLISFKSQILFIYFL